MADTFLFTNNAKSTLASGITAIATSIFLAPGDGALFPDPGPNEQFAVTLVDASQNIEICYCTERVTDTLTVIRGQEGTSGLPFIIGDIVSLRVTSEMCGYFVQQGLKGYGHAGGTADAITCLMVPALTSYHDGFVVFLRSAHAPTIINPTLNINSLGAKSIVKAGNQPLLVGDIPRADYECILRYNSVNDNFELLNPAIQVKVGVKDWGAVTTGTQIDLEDADFHVVTCSASITLTFASANTNDRASIAIKNTGGYTITVAGIDNNSPTLTVGTNIQDIIGLVKSHGKITLVGFMDNQSAV